MLPVLKRLPLGVYKWENEALLELPAFKEQAKKMRLPIIIN